MNTGYISPEDLELRERVAEEISRFVPDPWNQHYFADRIIGIIKGDVT